jgi:His/Glu/Gln/Arg/opine family amino acid ABC transporter permease subunit
MSLDLSVIIDNMPLFMDGALLTLRLTAIAFVGGLAIGAVCALISLMNIWPLRILITLYLALARGIPFIIIVFLVHFGLPAFGMRQPALISGTIALTLFAGAYYVEIIRSAVEALPRGQWESARAVGMSRFAAARYVIVPQIISPSIPPIVNCTMSMIKESAVLSAITVRELTFQGLVVQGNTFAPFEVFIAVALLYWAITLLFEMVARLYDRRFGAKGTRSRTMSPIAARYLSVDSGRPR